jgi:hypothetical protein
MTSEPQWDLGDLPGLAQEVVRRELEIAGQNRAAGQDTGDLAGLVRLGRGILLSVTDMAALTGLTRPTIYDLLKSHKGQSFDGYALRTAIAVYLAGMGMTGPGMVASVLKIERADALAFLRLLSEEGQAAEVLVGSDPATRTVFISYLKMQEFLKDRLLVIGDTRDSAYTFYFEVPDVEAAKLERAAERLLGGDQQSLIAAHASSAMRTAELAVSLHADDDRRAFTIAHEVWRAILKRARIKYRPPSIALALPPQRRARSHL